MRPAPKNKRMLCCDLCGYATKVRSYLLRHQLTHSNARPHTCEECGGRFKTVSDLNTHLRLHRNEEHVCEDCGFSCKQLKVLYRHRLVHEEKLHRVHDDSLQQTINSCNHRCSMTSCGTPRRLVQVASAKRLMLERQLVRQRDVASDGRPRSPSDWARMGHRPSLAQVW